NIVPASTTVAPGIDPNTGQPWVEPPIGNSSQPTWTTTTSWATYPSSVQGVETFTTESTTTTTTTTTKTSWTPPVTYTYVGPNTSATTAQTKPAWWPDGVPWPPED
ncbi:MAG: hypothetical protein FWC27_09615, partial [Firmicutes bacterium]|nr:hypothetical protein [Bacillota bacterium]